MPISAAELIDHLLDRSPAKTAGIMDDAGAALAPYRNNLIGGLAGAALGGGAMALGTNAEPGEDAGATRKRRLNNLLSGALAGGVAGAAAPTVAGMLPGADKPDTLTGRIAHAINPTTHALPGAVVGGVGGHFAGKGIQGISDRAGKTNPIDRAMADHAGVVTASGGGPGAATAPLDQAAITALHQDRLQSADAVRTNLVNQGIHADEANKQYAKMIVEAEKERAKNLTTLRSTPPPTPPLPTAARSAAGVPLNQAELTKALAEYKLRYRQSNNPLKGSRVTALGREGRGLGVNFSSPWARGLSIAGSVAGAGLGLYNGSQSE